MFVQIQSQTVHTKPAYKVCVGAHIRGQCGRYLRTMLPLCRIAVVTDSTVGPLYLKEVKESLREAGFSVSSHVFPAGESSKNISTWAEILESLASAQLTRRDCVVALGGGVTGDLAGFVAATYLRGIRFVQMPTTLLAAVDASVGGKTAVNLRSGKNLVGAFLQPTAVLCDTDCLRTLPPERWADGVAEAVKTAVLSDETLFSVFERGRLGNNLEEVILRCVRYKAGVVERDEREQGERTFLNLGHTVGHAIERCSDYTISHGHAVAIGMAVISRAAGRLGWAPASVSRRISDCLSANALPIQTEFSAEQLTQAALSDKKRNGDSITLVVPEQIGRCVLKNVSVAELFSVLSAGREA